MPQNENQSHKLTAAGCVEKLVVLVGLMVHSFFFKADAMF
jgi:hypothetical protein